MSKSAASTPAEKLRGAVEDGDTDSEDDLWSGGFSGKAMIGSWILAVGVSVGLIAAAFFFPPILLGLVLIWGWLGMQLAYKKLSVSYELTSQRFIHKTGILKRVTDRIEMIDIDDVTFEQGLLQRLVGVGTIAIQSSDRTHPELQLKGIDDVKRIADMIDDCRRSERRRRGLHIEAI